MGDTRHVGLHHTTLWIIFPITACPIIPHITHISELIFNSTQISTEIKIEISTTLSNVSQTHIAIQFNPNQPFYIYTSGLHNDYNM